MSDEDKKAYKQLLLIAVLTICAILFLFTVATLVATYGCFQLLEAGKDVPTSCENGGLTKFILEFLGIAVGVLGAVKLLGQ